MRQMLKIGPVECAVAVHHIADRVERPLAEVRRSALGNSCGPLVVPETSDDRPHVPCGNRFAEQWLAEGRRVVSLAVVEQLVQLLDPDTRKPASYLGCNIMCGQLSHATNHNGDHRQDLVATARL